MMPTTDEVNKLPREVAPGLFWLGICAEIAFQGTLPTAGRVSGTSSPTSSETGRLITYSRSHPEMPHMGDLAMLLEEHPGLRITGDLRNCAGHDRHRGGRRPGAAPPAREV